MKLKKEKALKSKLKRKLDLGLDSKNLNALERKNAKKEKYQTVQPQRQ